VAAGEVDALVVASGTPARGDAEISVRFVDEVQIEVRSGAGGKGSSSMRREKWVPFGGPDGGDGGRGGHVVFQADEGLGTLMDLRHRTQWQAGNGDPGGKRLRTGAQGEDLVIRVPVGTIVTDATRGAVLFELTRHGEARVAAEGGRGGLGNTHFKTSTNRAPKTTTPGEPGTTLQLTLELRLMADVGLLGYPNAGKSTLISVISAARPKIADYPFTTLTPNLGVVSMGDSGSFVVADIPGLIEGAAEGKGLGHQFLRHVQRTRMLWHLVSLSPDEPEPVDVRWSKLRAELARYDAEIAARTEIVVLTQADAVEAEDVEAARQALLAAGAGAPLVLSAVVGDGVPELLRAAWGHLLATRQPTAVRSPLEADEEPDRGGVPSDTPPPSDVPEAPSAS
jgi:GTP-binding protein